MFKSREQAGEKLAEKLQEYVGKKDVVVFGITRGGVVVAKVVADKLSFSLDIVVVKKIGAPQNPELAIGAVSGKRAVYWDENLCRKLGMSRTQMVRLKSQKERERKEQEQVLRQGKKAREVVGKTVVLVDDGVATGATVLAGEKYLRRLGAAAVTLATPVIAKDTLNTINKYFDKVITLATEENFYAVGQFYEEFPQVSDEEVIEILRD